MDRLERHRQWFARLVTASASCLDPDGGRMKAYLITTGTLFALVALVHVWRIVGEWPRLLTDRWEILEAAIGVAGGALSLWAWRLLRRSARA